MMNLAFLTAPSDMTVFASRVPLTPPASPTAVTHGRRDEDASGEDKQEAVKEWVQCHPARRIPPPPLELHFNTKQSWRLMDGAVASPLAQSDCKARGPIRRAKARTSTSPPAFDKTLPPPPPPLPKISLLSPPSPGHSSTRRSHGSHSPASSQSSSNRTRSASSPTRTTLSSARRRGRDSPATEASASSSLLAGSYCIRDDIHDGTEIRSPFAHMVIEEESRSHWSDDSSDDTLTTSRALRGRARASSATLPISPRAFSPAAVRSAMRDKWSRRT